MSCVDLARNPPDGVSVGLGEDENIFNWELLIVGPPDTLYEGGFFTAKLDFPSDFPNSPPVMTFKTPIWHPNGKSCPALFLQRRRLNEAHFALKQSTRTAVSVFPSSTLPARINSTNRYNHSPWLCDA